jgi:Fe-S cluster biosynthesis and repair protein YggX
MNNGNIDKEIKPNIRPSPSELLARVIDPTKDIKPIFEQHYRESALRTNENKITSYTPEQINNLTKEMSEYLFGEIIDSSKFLSDLRVEATIILEKDKILVNSFYEKTAEKMLRKVIDYSRDWLKKNDGQYLRIPFDFSPDKVIQDVKLLIDDQSKFIGTLRGEDNTTSTIRIIVPTHYSDPNITNDSSKFIDRIDNGEATVEVTDKGKIVRVGITEMVSYTSFSNEANEIPIMNLAFNIPDEFVSKFNFFGDAYSTGDLKDTKIKITGRMHDFAEDQFWIHCTPKKETTNQDCLNLIKLWLEKIKEFPRIPKSKEIV